MTFPIIQCTNFYTNCFKTRDSRILEENLLGLQIRTLSIYQKSLTKLTKQFLERNFRQALQIQSGVSVGLRFLKER